MITSAAALTVIGVGATGSPLHRTERGAAIRGEAGVQVGKLLRRARLRAGLTQEALAARSGVAIRTIGDLERGRIRRPHRRTLELLVTALHLDSAEQQVVARGLTGSLEADSATRPDDHHLGEYTASPAHDPGPGRTRWTLPTGPGVFVGRTEDLRDLTEILRRRPAPATLLSGAPGTGKTALALHAGQALGESFPDGQILLDCRGSTAEPVDVQDLLGFVLRAMLAGGGAVPSPKSEREALYRSLSRKRSMLLVLDDVAHEAQVRPFLHDGGVRLIITSRRTLSGIGAGVERMIVDRLTVPESVALTTALVGRCRVGAERAAVIELVGLCDRHPLALTVVGSRLATRPGWRIADMVERLRDERGRLSRLDLADLSVRDRLSAGFAALEAPARRLFAQLALLEGEAVSSRQVATVFLDGDAARAEALLDEITDAGMLVATSSSLHYRLPMLHRLFAVEVLNEPMTTGRLVLLPPTRSDLARHGDERPGGRTRPGPDSNGSVRKWSRIAQAQSGCPAEGSFLTSTRPESRLHRGFRSSEPDVRA